MSKIKRNQARDLIGTKTLGVFWPMHKIKKEPKFSETKFRKKDKMVWDGESGVGRGYLEYRGRHPCTFV